MEAYVKGAIVNDVDPGDFEKLVEPWLSEKGRASFYRQFAQADEKYTAEVEPVSGHIRCPVHIIWGEDDLWIPLTRGKALHALIPQASFETLPGAGHLPQLEAPELVLEKLSSFLSQEAGADESTFGAADRYVHSACRSRALTARSPHRVPWRFTLPRP